MPCVSISSSHNDYILTHSSSQAMGTRRPAGVSFSWRRSAFFIIIIIYIFRGRGILLFSPPPKIGGNLLCISQHNKKLMRKQTAFILTSSDIHSSLHPAAKRRAAKSPREGRHSYNKPHSAQFASALRCTLVTLSLLSYLKHCKQLIFAKNCQTTKVQGSLFVTRIVIQV